MKPSTFLLTHNEAAQPGAAFIVHTQEPAFVGQLLRFDNEEELNEFVSNKDRIRVDQRVIVHINTFLTSNEFKRFEWLKNKIRYWILENRVQG